MKTGTNVRSFVTAESFLSNREQVIIIYGAYVCLFLTVISGVPQGSVHGPLQCIIPTLTYSSTVTFPYLRTIEGDLSLQNDFSKCLSRLKLAMKVLSLETFSYNLPKERIESNITPLEITNIPTLSLGVPIDKKKLTFSNHITTITIRFMRMLSVLYVVLTIK